jgi:hypothetical protein
MRRFAWGKNSYTRIKSEERFGGLSSKKKVVLGGIDWR